MNSILRKKEVVYGLCFGLLLAISCIVYLVFFSSSPKAQQIPEIKMDTPKIVTPPPVNPADVKTVVGTGKSTLVFFHSPNCHHCVAAMPAWEQVVENLLNSNDFETMSINGSTNREEVIKAGGITGFPHYRLYKTGYPCEDYVVYNGDRSAASLLKFVHSDGNSV